jgi:hypothetical protein
MAFPFMTPVTKAQLTQDAIHADVSGAVENLFPEHTEINITVEDKRGNGGEVVYVGVWFRRPEDRQTFNCTAFVREGDLEEFLHVSKVVKRVRDRIAEVDLIDWESEKINSF